MWGRAICLSGPVLFSVLSWGVLGAANFTVYDFFKDFKSHYRNVGHLKSKEIFYLV